MPDRILIYHTYGALEWATSYWIESLPSPGAAAGLAANLQAAEANLICNDVSFSRWEMLSPAGIKVAEGNLSGTGAVTTDMMPIHYCVLLRLNSAGPGRPSTKYIHGYSEGFTTDGLANGTFNTALEAYETALYGLAYPVVDSDGVGVDTVTFRAFSRRRRMRRANA